MPEFVANEQIFTEANPGKFLIYDINLRRLNVLDGLTGETAPIELSESVFKTSSINIDGQIAVGANVLNPEVMLQFSNNENNHEFTVEYPETPSENAAKDVADNLKYLMSVNCIANTAKNRVIVPMYFFDRYYVYDNEGKLLRKISLGVDDFDISEALTDILSMKGFAGFTFINGTDEKVYLCRCRHEPEGNSPKIKETQIVETDWDGNPLRIFRLPFQIKGNFRVHAGWLYCITNSQDASDQEVYHIVRFRLPED